MAMQAGDVERRVARLMSAGIRPLTCVWEVTLACPLRCVHCGSRAGRPRPDELTAEQCLRVADELADLGCRTVTLSGGEPTLAPHWPAVAGALARRGVYVNMVTSGVFPSTTSAMEVARMAQDAGMGNVALSVDGPEAVHERIRGKGTFARVRRAAEALAAAGVPLAVITTINRWNTPHLERVADMVAHLGAVDWQVQLAKPMGNLSQGDPRAADLPLAPAQLVDLERRLTALKRTATVNLHPGDSIGYFGPGEHTLRPDTDGDPGWRGCMAGLRGLGLESNGDVKGCLSLQARIHGEDPFVEGNLRRSSLADIWSAPGAFSYNREFSAASLDGFCRTCDHAARCRGGARCVAAAATGALGHDPYCVHAVGLARSTRANRWRRRALAAAAAGMMLTLGPVVSRGDPCMSKQDTSPRREAGADQGARRDHGVAVAEYGAPACSCDAFDGGTADAPPPQPDVDVGSIQPEYGAVSCSMLPLGSKTR